MRLPIPDTVANIVPSFLAVFFLLDCSRGFMQTGGGQLKTPLDDTYRCQIFQYQHLFKSVIKDSGSKGEFGLWLMRAAVTFWS